MSAPIRPHVTEKSFALVPEGVDGSATYTYRVPVGMRAAEVSAHISSQFGVHVIDIRMVNLPSKVRRFRGIPGKTRAIRKALVRLLPGERIATYLPDTTAKS